MPKTRSLFRTATFALACAMPGSGCAPDLSGPPAPTPSASLGANPGPALSGLSPAEAEAALHPAVHAALMQRPLARVMHAVEGYPAFLTGTIGSVSRADARAVQAAEIDQAARQIAPLYGVSAESLALRRQHGDGLGASHLRFRQRVHGLDVIGGDMVVQVQPDGRISAVNSHVRGEDGFPSPARSRTRADQLVAARWSGAQIHGQRLVYVLPSHLPPRLAWDVDVTINPSVLDGRVRAYLDAEDGRLLLQEARVQHGLQREVYDLSDGVDSNTGLPKFDVLARAEGGPPVHDAVIDTNYDTLGSVYGCYNSGGFVGAPRDSWDGRGSPIVSGVYYHTGGTYNSSGWDPAHNRITFGIGTGDSLGQNYGNLGVSFDMVAHELTHGVTEATSSLIPGYLSPDYLTSLEASVLNESFSDVMAVSCDSYLHGYDPVHTWRLAEDAWPTGIRLLSNPAMTSLPSEIAPIRPGVASEDYYGEMDLTKDIHSNSTVASLAFYLVTQGDHHPRHGQTLANGMVVPNTPVPGLGIAATRQIWFRAFTQYLVPMSGFYDARLATVQAASDLYGYGSAQAQAVATAWDVVGVPRQIGFRPVWTQTGQASYAPYAIKTLKGDVNNDGVLDLVQLYNNGQLGAIITQSTMHGYENVWLNAYLGSPASSVTNALAYFLTDLNRDGAADLVHVWNSGGTVAITVYPAFLSGTDDSGRSVAGFSSSPSTVYTGVAVGTPVQFLLQDLSADGRPDLTMLGNNGGGLSVVVFQGGAGFQFSAVSNTPYMGQGYGSINGFLLSDLDGDGLPELIQPWNNGGQLGLIVYKGLGTRFSLSWWNATTGVSASPLDMQLADCDGDGLLDLYYTCNTSAGLLTEVFLSHAGQTSLTLSLAAYIGGPVSGRILVGDFSGNGLSDVLHVWDNGGRVAMSAQIDFIGGFRADFTNLNEADDTGTFDWMVTDLNQDSQMDLVQIRNLGGWTNLVTHGTTWAPRVY